MKKITMIVLLCCMLFAMPLSATAATVLIDPGHGGSDPGAIGYSGLREKEVNLDIALKVRDELIARGYEVIMTRSSDQSLSLQERIAISNRHSPDILVSIHANSYHKPDIAGTLVLYYDHRYPQVHYPASEAMVRLSPESRKLAVALLDGAVEATGSYDRGLLESSVYMVRMGSVPSALIETAFLSNPADEKLLRSQDFRKKMALGIASGIASYLPLTLNQHFGDVIGHWAHDSIFRLYELGIVEGNGRYYYPDRQLTRAEFVTILDRSGLLSTTEDAVDRSTEQDTHVDRMLLSADGSVTEDVYEDHDRPGDEAVEEKLAFSDLSEQHWAYRSVMLAAESGILEGFTDGTIRPDTKITRAEVTVILDRLVYGPDGDQIYILDSREALHRFLQMEYPPYVDVPLSEWYADAAFRLWNDKLIYGVSETSFAPHKIMTRAEAAVLIDRYIHN